MQFFLSSINALTIMCALYFYYQETLIVKANKNFSSAKVVLLFYISKLIFIFLSQHDIINDS